MMSDKPMSHKDAPLSRQGFLKLGLGLLAGHLADSVNAMPLVAAASVARLRPPGALPEPAFLETCQAFCTACAGACPKSAITADPFGFPMVDPTVAPCVMCTEVPCTQVCPTSALAPLSSPLAIRMGTAQIEVTTCVAFSGQACSVCVDVCPITGTAITLTEGLPQVLADACTGCGVCVHHCPTPGAIGVIPNRVA